MRRFWWMLAFGVLLAAQACAGELYTTNSQSYTIVTDLDRGTAQQFARYMDQVYRLYADICPGTTLQKPLVLYLFSTRADYLNYATTTAKFTPSRTTHGFYCEADGKLVTALCLEDDTLATVLPVLQHEGLHAFLLARYGKAIPIWAQEGLATYASEWLMGPRALITGIVPIARLDVIQPAVTGQRYLPIGQLMVMTPEEWSRLSATKETTNLLYCQTWSMVHFLLHAERGKYRPLLQRYLQRAAEGVEPTALFTEIFQTDYETFAKYWTPYVAQLVPDVTPGELMKLAEALKQQPTSKMAVITTTPPDWERADRPAYTLRVRVMPIGPHLPPNLIAYGPRYTLRLDWRLDETGKRAEQLRYEEPVAIP